MLLAQIVMVPEKLRLRIERCLTLREMSRLAMRRREVLSSRPGQTLQKQDLDLLERNQFFYAEDFSWGN